VKALENHIESIITRKISGEISADEQLILNGWLAASSENKRYFQDLEKIYQRAEKNLEDTPRVNINQEWLRFKNAVNPEKKITTYRTSWVRVAASIVVIITLGYLIWDKAFQADKVTVIAQYSGQVITLPDSSVITLNKHASLTYPYKFSGKQRLVTMSGEAFFEVTRNENKPFIVNMDASSVEVLGTSFNINATEDNIDTEVTVNTGKVRFTSTVSNESVILIKGEKGTLMRNNHSISKAQNNDVNFMAWKTRKIVFNDVELDEVIQTLNKLYEAHITFTTDVSKNCKVTVSFDNQSIEAIMSVLELTLDLEYKKTGNLIEVVKTGC
jgi:transmembrane sensor